MRNLLAFDLGASNGRAILGRFDGTRVTLHELHRFENNYIEMNGVFYWDLPYLYQQLKLGFLAFRQANMGELDCFGIDAWGVDSAYWTRTDIFFLTQEPTATLGMRIWPKSGSSWTLPISSPVPVLPP